MQPDQTAQTEIHEAAQKLERILTYLAVDPHNRDLLASAIDLQLRVGQLDKAEQSAQAALALYPQDPFFRHRLSNVLIAQNRLDDAAAVLEQLNLELVDPNIAYNLAYVYIRQAKYQETYDALAPHLDSTSLSLAAVTLLARALHHLGDLKKAIDIVAPHLDNCTDAELLGVASLLYLDDGQMEQASKLSLAAQANGAHPLEALVVAGTVALGVGDAATADAQFSSALAINPFDGRSWSGLGLSSMLKRDLPGAEEQLEKAVAYMPAHIGTWHMLGWCKIIGQDLDGAETIFRKALEMDRNFGESHGGLAVVAAFKGDKDLANESIERALRLDPKGMAARYAQMVLSGVVKDPVKFRELALKLMATRKGPNGENFADIVAKWTAQ